ncbi:MAG: hypothetical protein CVT66_01105 [Actinobacteria bacterium HGW-Actinobacteria-6]|nr:MAG: hypothetical protein CVT66_01105 [Actinobacteria bacterium HGW-Actinobacteria-6]
MNTRIAKRLLTVALVALAAAALLGLTGCATEQLKAEAGQVSCAGCHTDRELLKADLAATPLPVVEKAESSGEG